MRKIINTNDGSLILRISDSCQWNCPLCAFSQFNKKWETFFQSQENILKAIDRISELAILNKVSILSDNITRFEWLENIINKLREKWVKEITISWEENFDENYVKLLKKLWVRLHYFINYLQNNSKHILDLLNRLDSLEIEKTVVIDISFNDNKKFLMLILKYLWEYKVIDKSTFLCKWYIMIEDTKVIFWEKTHILQTKYNCCLSKNNIVIDNNIVKIKNSLDLNMKWDIYLHKVPCILWSYKWFPISNIYQNNEKILKDFKNHYTFLSENESDDMTKSCNMCIKNPFNYKNVNFI